MASSDHPLPLHDRGELELRCTRCGHDLRALSINANCPTCALPVRASIRVDFTEVEVPTVCGRCGYDLRGLAGDRCPECGATLVECATRPGPLWEKAIEWVDGVDLRCPDCGGHVEQGRCVVCRAVASSPTGATPRRLADSRRVLESYDAEPLPLVLAMRRRIAAAALLIAIPIAVSLVISLVFASAVTGPSGGVMGALLAAVTIVAGPMAPLTQPAFAAITAVGVAFPLAVWILTIPVRGAVTASPKLGHGARARKLARWASLAWWLVPGFSAAIAMSGDTSLQWWFIGSMSVALLSLGPINFHLRNLAAWLVDEKADHFFNVGLWCSLLAPLVPLGLAVRGSGLLITVLGGLAASAAYYGTAAGLLFLARSAWWSVLHAERRRERDARRLEQARRRFAEVAERVGRTNPTPGRRPK